MKIAIIGYGRMGREIEKMAQQRNHQITVKIDKENARDFDSTEFAMADVAIEFSMPETAVSNYKKCFERNIPVVSGTTGWLHKLSEVEAMVGDGNQTFFYASNFSLGVNLQFYFNKLIANVMKSVEQYDVHIEETHHIHKKDAPSGTAITLAQGILSEFNNLTDWQLNTDKAADKLPVYAKREGEVAGIHHVVYKSGFDELRLSHAATSRRGFALGAIMAAEYLQGKKGIFSMENLLNLQQNKIT